MKFKPIQPTNIVIIFWLFISFNTQASKTTLITVPLDDIQGAANAHKPSLSGDGRYMAYASFSEDVLDGVNEPTSGIFVHDFLTRQSNRISIDSNGAQANNYSRDPQISLNGRFVVFWSIANNLVANDTNNAADIFVHDRATRQTMRVSINSQGDQANDNSYAPSISSDGRYVVFSSHATNLDPTDTNNNRDVFIHDRESHQTKRISIGLNGVQSNGESFDPQISANGRYVGFISSSSNLVFGDRNNIPDLFLHDLISGYTSRINVSTTNQEAEQPVTNFSFNGDARFITFASKSKILKTAQYTTTSAVFIRDRLFTKTRQIITSPLIKSPDFPTISTDGRLILFCDSNDKTYIYNRLKLTTSTVNFDRPDKYKGCGGSMNASGRFIAQDALDVQSGLFFQRVNIFLLDRILNVNLNTDLKIVTTKKPDTLLAGTRGSFTYRIVNNGLNSVNDASALYHISGGNAVAFYPSQGSCKNYVSFALCSFGKLASGRSAWLGVVAQANRNQFNQQLSVSAALNDIFPNNNFVSVTVPVINY
jgi:hypothetical protein